MKPEYVKWFGDTFPEMYAKYIKEDIYSFACGDGLFSILKAMSYAIQFHVTARSKEIDRFIKLNEMISNGIRPPFVSEHEAMPLLIELPPAIDPVIINTVKEKFGTLRIYFHGGDEKIRNFVEMTEYASSHICHHCGAPASNLTFKNWIRTLCPKCAEDYQT